MMDCHIAFSSGPLVRDHYDTELYGHDSVLFPFWCSITYEAWEMHSNFHVLVLLELWFYNASMKESNKFRAIGRWLHGKWHRPHY
jgi:hypothetical protein